MRLRELLVERYMARHGMRDRPRLVKITDGLIEDALGARLITDDPLPMDRYAQTEVEHGMIRITINRLIPRMRGVVDPEGVGYISRWLEIVHVVRDAGVRDPLWHLCTPPMPSFSLIPPRMVGRRIVICREVNHEGRHFDPKEFVAENVALAAAISVPDLARCAAFEARMYLGGNGGELGPRGWNLIRKTAEFLGVNRSALVRYLERRGLVYVVEQSGRRELVATKNLYRGLEWLEPRARTNASVA